MSSNILFAWGLAVSTVIVHAVGIALMLRLLDRRKSATKLWAVSWRLAWVAVYLVLLHLAEISIWAAFYLWQQCLPDLETALYFSAVTYATIGYGEVVLATPWRLLAPIEGLTGILMCGLSTGLFFAMVNHIYQQAHTRTRDEHEG
ncbi:potassium channel family protein [Pseudomonas sp. MHK4]